MVNSFSVKTNDYMHVIYVCSLIRAVISLHSLINNKISTKETEKEQQKREEELRKKKEEEAKKKVEEALARNTADEKKDAEGENESTKK